MSTLFVSGASTTMFARLDQLLDDDVEVMRNTSDWSSLGWQPAGHLPVDAERYLFAAGHLEATTILEQGAAEIARHLAVNLMAPVKAAEHVLARNPVARICVVGSESAIKGSHNTTYGVAKAALHRYVETRRLEYPGQQLVCVAPGMIADSGMTRRRADQHNVEASRPGARAIPSAACYGHARSPR